MDRFNKFVNKSLGFLDNPYIANGLRLFLVIYAGLAAPKLPPFIKKLFDNALFRVLILFLVVYTGYKDPITAAIIAITFVYMFEVLNKIQPFKGVEAFENDVGDDVIDEVEELIKELDEEQNTLPDDIDVDTDDEATGYADPEFNTEEFDSVFYY